MTKYKLRKPTVCRYIRYEKRASQGFYIVIIALTLWGSFTCFGQMICEGGNMKMNDENEPNLILLFIIFFCKIKSIV